MNLIRQGIKYIRSELHENMQTLKAEVSGCLQDFGTRLKHFQQEIDRHASSNRHVNFQSPDARGSISPNLTLSVEGIGPTHRGNSTPEQWTKFLLSNLFR